MECGEIEMQIDEQTAYGDSLAGSRFETLFEEEFSLGHPALYLEDEELDLFLGSLMSKVGRAVGSATKSVAGALSTVAKVLPLTAIMKKMPGPLGLAISAGMGALDAAAKGQNLLKGAARGVTSNITSNPLVRFGTDVAQGKNVLKSAGRLGKTAIDDAREGLRYAAMVAPFVPGIGTGVAAALGAANALAAGKPITEALVAAARSAVPGGAIAQTAFDIGAGLASGKSVSDAVLNAARNRLPGGPAAGAAFDSAVALAKGKSIQDAAFAATGRLLPPSPYAADAVSFVRRVASGENIQKAALSSVGNLVMKQIEKRTGTFALPAQRQVASWPVQRLAKGNFTAALVKRRNMQNEAAFDRNIPVANDKFIYNRDSARRTTITTGPLRPDLHRAQIDVDIYNQHGRAGRWFRTGNEIVLSGV
jgi:hypothetical protein